MKACFQFNLIWNVNKYGIVNIPVHIYVNNVNKYGIVKVPLGIIFRHWRQKPVELFLIFAELNYFSHIF